MFAHDAQRQTGVQLETGAFSADLGGGGWRYVRGLMCGNPEPSPTAKTGPEGSQASPWGQESKLSYQAGPLQPTQASPRAKCVKLVICLPNGHVTLVKWISEVGRLLILHHAA